MYEHMVMQVPLHSVPDALDRASAEGWDLVSIPGMGAAAPRLAGAGGPVPVLLCVLRREKGGSNGQDKSNLLAFGGKGGDTPG